MRKEKDFIYLDNNATTHIAPEVLDALSTTYLRGPLNPSSQHSIGHHAKRLLLSARENIASFLRVPTSSIIFLSSATEGLNQLFYTFSTGRIISTRLEHASLYELTKNYSTTDFVSVSSDGTLDLNEIESLISEETSALFFSYANSETGTLFPIDQLTKLASKYEVPLIIDGVAALGKTPIHIPAGITAMVFSGHKIHGPAGSAFMYVNPKAKIKPLLRGGGQEHGVRSGTEAVANVIGLSRAISLLDTSFIAYMTELQKYFENTLKNELPDVEVLGGTNRVANVSTIVFPGIDAESLLIRLDMLGVYASHGSACSAGAMEPSRVLLEMGVPIEKAKAAIRFSFSRYTTSEEVEKAIAYIIQAVSEQHTLKIALHTPSKNES